MKKVFQGDIFSVWQWDQKLYDGSTKVFEKVRRTDAAFIIGVLPDKRILLIWDEQPDREGALGPAGGKVEEGENPIDAAAREFLEETGYKAASIHPWMSYIPYGKMIFTVHCFIGKNCEKVAEPTLEAGERITPRFFTFEEFIALGQEETLRSTHLRVILLEAQIDPKKRELLYNTLYG
jgi:ADP-ribose pyrophosphatase